LPSYLGKAMQDKLSSTKKPLQSSETSETTYLMGQCNVSEDLNLQPHFVRISDVIIGHGVTNNKFIQHIIICCASRNVILPISVVNLEALAMRTLHVYRRCWIRSTVENVTSLCFKISLQSRCFVMARMHV